MQLAGLLVRFVFAMAVVLGLMVLAGKVVRSRGLLGPRRNGRATIEVVARQAFGKSASVAVVRAAGKALVLGVTDQSVTVLAEADPDALDIDLTASAASGTPTASGSEAQWTAPSGGEARPGQPWKTLLEQLRERTVRR